MASNPDDLSIDDKCERSGEGAFGAHQNPRLMLGSVVGGVRLSVGVGGGDLEAVVLAETP
jgi:hypothetical protein